ncbi:MAG: zf-HC2 domain-containing protein [Myxococcota bacterium]
MTERWTHDDVRDRAFEYRRGELEPEKRESVEAHLESCAACRDYVEKLFTLMSSPTDIEAPSDDYADALFGEIVARMESEKGQAERGADEGEAVFAPAASGFRWGTAAIGLAAGFLLAVGIGWLLSSTGMFSADRQEDVPAVADKQVEQEPSAARQESPVESTAATQLADLRAEPSNRAGVGILASKGASWSLAGDDELVLDLERGTVLVEYLPREGRQFRVEAPGMNVRVVGTIFYVSTDGRSSAGVVTGEVEVEHEGGEAVQVREGQRIISDGQVEPMPTKSVEALRAQVDVRRHHAALRKRMDEDETSRKRADDVDASEPEPARVELAPPTEADEPPGGAGELNGVLAKRRAEAEAAIRAGKYRRAETIYGDLVEQLDPAHPAAPSIHLDLAGLYLEQMDRPEKALPYLRGFLRKWPNDVASSAVKRRLCAVVDELGVDDPRCTEPTSDQ